MISFRFNAEKAIEAIVYISQEVEDADIHTICEIFYLADKQYLEEFGGVICGDIYHASPEGPVPMAILTILEAISEDRENPFVNWIAEKAFDVREDKVIPRRSADKLEFSEADEICMQKACSLYKNGGIKKLVKDNAYYNAFDNDKPNLIMSYESIIATLKNVEGLVDYLIERGC